MNVKDFEYVVEIAQHGSISKAANRLYVSQPTLSKFLQRMETEFGTPLFHRMGKQLLPTPAGEKLLENARRILNLNREINEEVHRIADNREGIIRLGAPQSRGEFVLSTVIPPFKRRYPSVQVSLEMGSTQNLIAKLEDNQRDILLMNYTLEKPALHYEQIGQEEMVLAVPAKSHLVQLAQEKPGRRFPVVPTAEWVKEPFILGEQP